eukprot:TRINITY_DN19152_c0_g1_i1.p1 TRINITY_DN19152_c0_g1~~TRINITY_DN19152_c0_g1_i1.p1  ORF type:complete len:145 (-),score=50.44 TRINITY_DN19152_c0_g1_i1:200-634(-)
MTEFVVRGGGDSAIKSIKDLPQLQDGPPPGGFPAVRYARRIANSGPSGAALALTSASIIAYGMYQVGQGNLKRRELKKEKMDARMAILPLIQAEEDARFVRERKKQLEEEAELMKNVPGWKVGASVYSSGRWMPPATGKLGPDF